MSMLVRSVEEHSGRQDAAFAAMFAPGSASVQAILLDETTDWLASHPIVDEVVQLERVAVLVEDDLLGLCADPAVRVALFVHGVVGGVRPRVDVPQDVPTASWRTSSLLRWRAKE